MTLKRKKIKANRMHSRSLLLMKDRRRRKAPKFAILVCLALRLLLMRSKIILMQTRKQNLTL